MAKEIEYPKIRFSRWVPWHKRNTLVEGKEAFEEDTSYPGLYLLGQFDEESPSPTIPACHTDKHVIYIGMSENIRNRPIKAHTKQHQHKLQCDDPSLQHLYVALFDIPRWGWTGKLGVAEKAWLEYKERQLIWEHAAACDNKKPALNDTDPGRARKREKRIAKQKADRQAKEEMVAMKTAEAKARLKAHREGLS